MLINGVRTHLKPPYPYASTLSKVSCFFWKSRSDRSSADQTSLQKQHLQMQTQNGVVFKRNSALANGRKGVNMCLMEHSEIKGWNVLEWIILYLRMLTFTHVHQDENLPHVTSSYSRHARVHIAHNVLMAWKIPLHAHTYAYRSLWSIFQYYNISTTYTDNLL